MGGERPPPPHPPRSRSRSGGLALVAPVPGRAAPPVDPQVAVLAPHEGVWGGSGHRHHTHREADRGPVGLPWLLQFQVEPLHQLTHRLPSLPRTKAYGGGAATATTPTAKPIEVRWACPGCSSSRSSRSTS